MVPEPGLVTVMMKCSVLVVDHCVCAFCRSCVAFGALEPPQPARATTATHRKPVAAESDTRARIWPGRGENVCMRGALSLGAPREGLDGRRHDPRAARFAPLRIVPKG